MSALLPHAVAFALLRRFGLLRVLLWPAAGDNLVGTGADVHENVVEKTYHIRMSPERRHDVLLSRGDVLAAVHHDVGEIRIAHGLERALETGRIARALRVRPVAGVAIGVIPAKSRIRVPVDGSILLDLVGRIALGVGIFAVLLLDGRRVAGPVGPGEARAEQERQEERPDERAPSHDRFLRLMKLGTCKQDPARRSRSARRSALRSSERLAQLPGSENTVSWPPSAV